MTLVESGEGGDSAGTAAAAGAGPGSGHPFAHPVVSRGTEGDRSPRPAPAAAAVPALSPPSPDLDRDHQAVVGAFFRHVEPKDGKFGDFAFQNGTNGAPIITDAPASVECEVVGFYELGDHSIVVGKVTEAHINRDAEPLTMKETGWNYGG